MPYASLWNKVSSWWNYEEPVAGSPSLGTRLIEGSWEPDGLKLLVIGDKVFVLLGESVYPISSHSLPPPGRHGIALEFRLTAVRHHPKWPSLSLPAEAPR